MAAKTAARRPEQQARILGGEDGFGAPAGTIPTYLAGVLLDNQPDIPRHWCTMCGLPDALQPEDRWPGPPVPCPRCGSTWQWYGRIADRDGTATGPPEGQCLDCYDWRRYPPGQEHFGWAWWCTCGLSGCGHEHHRTEVWLA